MRWAGSEPASGSVSQSSRAPRPTEPCAHSFFCSSGPFSVEPAPSEVFPRRRCGRMIPPGRPSRRSGRSSGSRRRCGPAVLLRDGRDDVPHHHAAHGGHSRIVAGGPVFSPAPAGDLLVRETRGSIGDQALLVFIGKSKLRATRLSSQLGLDLHHSLAPATAVILPARRQFSQPGHSGTPRRRSPRPAVPLERWMPGTPAGAARRSSTGNSPSSPHLVQEARG